MRRIIRITLYGLLLLALVMLFSRAWGEEGWIMCQPDSYVNVRERASKSSPATGYLELGDRVETGRSRNGYTWVTGITNESGEGWVSSGYIVRDPIEIGTVNATVDAKGRVACRRSIGGDRRKWLHGGDQITLYATSDEWSLTSEGFIRTEYVLAER